MNCPKCQFPLNEDVALCPECGEKVSDTQKVVIPEKSREDTLGATTVIPVVGVRKTAEHGREESAPKAENAPAPEKAKKEKSARTGDAAKTKILTVLVAFLATLVVGLGIALAAISIGSMDRADKTDTVQGVNTDNKKNEEEEKIAPDELTVGESICVPEQTGIKIDTSYSFERGKKLTASALDYKTLRNSELGYKCDIPSEFVFLSDADGEIRYGSADKTAYMDIGAFSNTSELCAADVKSMISKELGTTAEYEVSGDDWFVMRNVKNGIVYYHKCFASSDLVRYIEFVYPSEYGEVYDVYVNDIESTFEKIN